MNLLYLVEPNKAGGEHLSFNAAILHMLQQKHAADEIVLFLDAGHHERLLGMEPEARALRWRPIRVVSGLERSFIKKFLVELVVVLRLLAQARRRRARVVLLSVFPNVLAVLLMFRWLFRKVDVHAVLHGEVESLIIPEKAGIRREGFWAKLALLGRFRGDWPNLYVLGRGIKSRLVESFPDSRQLARLHVIEHPYRFPAQPTDTRSGSALRIGFVGAGRLVKGIDEFCRLAQAFSEEIRAGAIEFVVVGGLERRDFLPGQDLVQVLADSVGGLSAADYFRAIGTLDCAVFLYRQNYRFTASGAVFDVIAQNVEILSLNNHYLSDLAQGDEESGIKFFDDFSGIEAEIRRRVRHGIRSERFHYPRIKKVYSAEAQATLLHEIIRRGGDGVA